MAGIGHPLTPHPRGCRPCAGSPAPPETHPRARPGSVGPLLGTARQPGTGLTGVYSPVYGWGVVDAAAAVKSPGATTAKGRKKH
ncbi:hypothetical protein HW130_11855 [Streptomyces sp. PKU-EA00015]|uniref:hypothetical protein n=1 Tax=Streptomyces sp. PKU-EA00015 TaxID=2748326 RepID=UPI0015A43FF0|nr:hypothetical protein [Streptomyces sp. PKU-EA00015]NWF26956.1 hypothetical protein [Streptomyces sp. PKU-EA00015]